MGFDKTETVIIAPIKIDEKVFTNSLRIERFGLDIFVSLLVLWGVYEEHY